MTKSLRFLACAVFGLAMLIAGWIMPIYLRGVDVAVLERAGRKLPGITGLGLTEAAAQRLSPAVLLLHSAQLLALPDTNQLGEAIATLSRAQPELRAWGEPIPLWSTQLGRQPEIGTNGTAPITDVALRFENRDKLLAYLGGSPRTPARELLGLRQLTNTVIFPPSLSPSGQALDAAIAVCGLLLDGDHLSKSLTGEIGRLVAAANHGGETEPLEQILLDFMSLGQRLNWGELVAFTHRVEDAETLRLLVNQVREGVLPWPHLFTAVALSGRPADTVHYLLNFSRTGSQDLVTSLATGGGGIGELLDRKQPVFISPLRQQARLLPPLAPVLSLTLGYCWLMPRVALAIKWLLFLGAGFLFAFGWQGLRSVRPSPGIGLAREILFALGFLLVVLILSEPFLAQENQKVATSFRLRLPQVGDAVPAVNPGSPPSTMTQPYNLLILLLFFVLQGLIYIACLMKLAEIRRQPAPPRLKLKLLENEEHLFDAGLYLGFAGTIICLILASLKIINGSLMAAYSSTSFGIVFVSIFKIFQLRPTRRRLLLEADTARAEEAAATRS